MDYQHRPGGKTGSGGVASWSDANRDQKQRAQQLAMEIIDIDKDPYLIRNHLGTYECKLCLTLHNNPETYLIHTQGKKHQHNLLKRSFEQSKANAPLVTVDQTKVEYKSFVKIGRPGYKVTKQRDPDTNQQSMLIQIDYPEIAEAQGVLPRYRFMSAYEQRVEPAERGWQYLIFAAEPYESIAFKVPSKEIDTDSNKTWSFWNKAARQFYMQFTYKIDTAATQASNNLRQIEEQRIKAQETQQQLQTLSEESANISGYQQVRLPNPGFIPALPIGSFFAPPRF